jgi:pimeloyl-ACP methyl ester carboxylesterase
MDVLNGEWSSAQPEQSVTLSEGPLYYRQSGSGFPLLLLHGWGASSLYWYDTLQTLSNVYCCYAPDMPGSGVTPAMNEVASAEHLADLVIAFADALHIPQFDLNGHSFGGAVAVYIATRYPERVRHLVLTSFGAFCTELEWAMMTQFYHMTTMVLSTWKPCLMAWRPCFKVWQRWLAQVGCEASLYDVARPFFVELPTDDALLCAGYSDFVCTDYPTLLESSLSLANPSLRESLSNIAVPALLVGGRQDRMILPSRIEETAQLIPRRRLAWIDQCGHLPMIERPTEYHQILRDFLVV